MPDPAKIIERIRSFGSNIVLDGRKLEIVNPTKLPEGAAAYVRQRGKEIAAFLDREAEFEERAAIIEFDGGAPRDMAEAFANVCIEAARGRWPEPDRAWFIGRCAAIIDEAAGIDTNLRRAA